MKVSQRIEGILRERLSCFRATSRLNFKLDKFQYKHVFVVSGEGYKIKTIE